MSSTATYDQIKDSLSNGVPDHMMITMLWASVLSDFVERESFINARNVFSAILSMPYFSPLN